MRKIYFVLLISTIAFSCMAQNVGEAFYIYRNDGQFNAFFRDEVLSIEYSNYDLDSLLHEDWQTQVIYTEDSIYRIPLTVIDSVSFVKPEATYKEDVTYLGASLFDYIVSVNGQDIIFRSDTPEYLLPKIGNKIATVDLTDIFPYGFLGIVSAIDNVYDGIRIRCNSLALEDAVSRFYCIIQFNSHQESYSKHRAYYSRRPLKIKDFGPITIPYQVPNTLFERKDVMGFGGQASFTFALDPDLDIIFTIAIDDNEDVLSYNARINHAVQYTVDEEIVGAISKEWKETFYSQDFPLIWGFTFYFDLGLKAELSGELALGYHSSTSLRSGLDLTYYPKKPLDSKIVRWLYKSDGEDNLLYLAGKAEGKLGGYFGMGIGLVDHGLAKFGCEFELGIKGTAEFSLNLGELADNTSTSCYDKCKDQKADLSLYLGAYLVASLFEGDNKMIDDYEGGKGWWDDFSVQFSYGEDWNTAKLYEGYMLPQFEHVSLLRHDDDKTEADASYTIPYNSIQKCKIGFVLYDSEGYFVEQKFYPEYYSNKTESSPLYPLTFTGLNPKEVYTIYPCINVLENDMLASPKYSENMVLLLLNDADEVELNSAKLSGRVVPNDGWKGRKVYFQYTKVPKYIGEVEKWETVDATYDEELKSYSLMLTDLIPATNYKYRMNCDNYGEELYSEEKTFKTKDYEVTVDNVTVKNPYSASLSGRILGYDPSQGHVYFNYTTDWTNGTWNEVDANYDAGTGLFTVKLTGLKPATKYFFKLIYVIYEDIYESITFNFVTNDFSRELPVIFKFQQTSSMYQPDGFTYKGDTYSFEYGSAVTCQWSEAENAEDFGYVYEDLKGDTAHVSMKQLTSPYLDSRYVYYRNEPESYARLYGYIKYYGDDKFYHGEKTDYLLLYDKQPEATTLEPIFVDTKSAKIKCAYKEAAPWGGTCGVEYWADTHINDSKKIYFETADEEIEIPLNDLLPNTTYYYQAFIKVGEEYAENFEDGFVWADDADGIKSFTTLPVVTFQTGEAYNVEETTALLTGAATGFDWTDERVELAFFYSTEPDVINNANGKSVTASYDEDYGVSASVSGLTEYTTYYYTLGVKCGDHDFVYGETHHFQTNPTVTTLEDPTASSNSVTLYGTCSKGITVAGFSIKKNGELGYTQYGAVPDASGNFSITIDGLDALTAYTYYAFVQVDDKSFPGVECHFSTTQPPVTYSTGEATAVDATTATLNGTINYYDPNDESVKFKFFYHTDANVFNGKSVTATYDGNISLTASISDLKDYTTYYYALAAKQGDADYLSHNVESFKTSPVVATLNNAAVTSNSVTLQGTCSKGITITGFAVRKNGSSSYTQYGANVDEDGNFSAIVDALDAATTYSYYGFVKADNQHSWEKHLPSLQNNHNYISVQTIIILT